MGLGVTGTSGVGVDVVALMEEASRAAGDSRKDAKITRKLHFNKNMRLMDQGIGKMKDQLAEQKKASGLGFVFGMVSNFMNLATQVLSAIFPVAAPVFMAVNKMAQSVLGTVSKQVVDSHNLKAQDEGIKSENFKKLAEGENNKFAMEDERIKAMTESDQTVKNRLEKAIDSLQKAAEAAVRV